MTPRRRWQALALVTLAVAAVAILVVRDLTRHWPRDVVDGASPRFAGTDVLELSKLARVSRFRSGVGHDFSNPPESCRSMKHYLKPVPGAGTIEVRAPFSGSVTDVQEEGFPGRKQLYIRSREHPAYTVRLFHVEPAPGVGLHAEVAGGQLVGTFPATDLTDVAVVVRTWGGERFVSIYDILTDDAFAPYASRGISRADLIMTRAERDAHPFRCDPADPNQNFADHSDDTPADWVDVAR